MEETQKENVTCVPNKAFCRNEFGLICDKSVVYVYNDDGSINWRKMIKPDFLVPNKEAFKKKGLPVPDSIEGLPDAEMLILLDGIKDLANIRGFSSVDYSISVPTPEYVCSVCKITWIPNFETNGSSVSFSGIGDANPSNTTGFGKTFLGPIAENRSFCRAVRNFLRIPVMSNDEVNESVQAVVNDPINGLLRDAMNKYNIPFEKIKASLIKENYKDADKVNSIEDISKEHKLELIGRIKKKAAEKGV